MLTKTRHPCTVKHIIMLSTETISRSIQEWKTVVDYKSFGFDCLAEIDTLENTEGKV